MDVPISSYDTTSIWVIVVFIVALVSGLLAGGGIASIYMTIKRAKTDIDTMTHFERMYRNTSEQGQQAIQTVERLARLLAVMLPTSDFKTALKEIGDFAEEMSDGVPIIDKANTDITPPVG